MVGHKPWRPPGPLPYKPADGGKRAQADWVPGISRCLGQGSIFHPDFQVGARLPPGYFKGSRETVKCF